MRTDPSVGVVGDGPGRGESVDPGHAHVHQDHVGLQPVARRDPFGPVRGLADHVDVVFRVEQRAQPASHECLVVDEQHGDHRSPSDR